MCFVRRMGPAGEQWLPDKDSNLDSGLQRAVCCHYTIGQAGKAWRKVANSATRHRPAAEKNNARSRSPSHGDGRNHTGGLSQTQAKSAVGRAGELLARSWARAEGERRRHGGGPGNAHGDNPGKA